MNCICLKWARDDEANLMLDAYHYLEQHIEVGRWHRAVQIFSIRSVHQFVRRSYAEAVFTFQITWPLHMSYINIFNKVRQ